MPSYEVLLFLMLVLPACAPRANDSGGDGGAAPAAVREVLAAQERRFGAMLRQDLATLEAALADELTYTHTSANREGKTEFLATIGSGALRYTAIKPEDVRVRLYGATAVVHGIARFRVVNRDGRESQFGARFTEVLVRRKGRWQTVSWQSTRLPA